MIGAPIVEVVREGSMPTCDYLCLHSSARPSMEERQTLAQGLETTFGSQLDGAKDNPWSFQVNFSEWRAPGYSQQNHGVGG